jgi:hypothetical protein
LCLKQITLLFVSHQRTIFGDNILNIFKKVMETTLNLPKRVSKTYF